jgi:hypothetical protein
MLRIVPTLIVSVTAAAIGAWAIFVGLAYVGGSDIGMIPRFDSVPTADLADLTRATVTAAGVIVGIFAVVYAYRKQRVEEAAGRRADSELLGKRFSDAVEQLGHDSAAVRLGGVHALSRLADDDVTQRPVIINVLCSYIRLPYSPEDAPRGEREVRWAVINTIAGHLQDPEDVTTWCGVDLDFSGATFDGGSFNGAKFIGCDVTFEGATFVGGVTSFNKTEFVSGDVSFGSGSSAPADINGGEITFIGARFVGGSMTGILTSIRNGGRMTLAATEFANGSKFWFSACDISDGGSISFGDIEWRGSTIRGGIINFAAARIREGGALEFEGIRMEGGSIDFKGLELSGGEICFDQAVFTGGKVSFPESENMSGVVSFHAARGADQIVTPWPVSVHPHRSTRTRSE